MFGRNGRLRGGRRPGPGHAPLLILAPLLALIPLLAAGCAMAGPDDDPEIDRQPITVVVENRNLLDATIYAETGTQRFRLGTVGSMTTGRFRIPAARCGHSGLELRAELVGSRESIGTGLLLPTAGSRIDWLVGNADCLSSVQMR